MHLEHGSGNHAPEKRDHGRNLPRHDASQLQDGADDGRNDEDEVQPVQLGLVPIFLGPEGEDV